MVKRGTQNEIDANTLDEPCIFCYVGGDNYATLHYPSGYCLFVHLKTNGYYPYVQICFSYSGDQIWIRTREPSPSTNWYSWHVLTLS